MGERHKHCEVIKAWADGADIQYRPFTNTDWRDTGRPEWINDGSTEYRVKPAPEMRYVFATDVLGYDPKDRNVHACNLKLEFLDGKLVGSEVLE